MPRTGTYSIKFMCGALQGEWLRGQTWRQTVRLFNMMAEMLDTTVSELFKTSFMTIDGQPNAFAYKGEALDSQGRPHYSCVLYIVTEYED